MKQGMKAVAIFSFGALSIGITAKSTFALTNKSARAAATKPSETTEKFITGFLSQYKLTYLKEQRKSLRNLPQCHNNKTNRKYVRLVFYKLSTVKNTTFIGGTFCTADGRLWGFNEKNTALQPVYIVNGYSALLDKVIEEKSRR